MSGDERGDYSVLQKIQVKCRTCGISESYYSNLSVEQFKSRHRSHDVVVSSAKGVQRTAPPVEPAPREEEQSFRENTVKPAKVRQEEVRQASSNPTIRTSSEGKGARLSVKLSVTPKTKPESITEKYGVSKYDTVGGAPRKAPQEARPTVYAVKPAPKEESMDSEPRTRLAKVNVDLVLFPGLPDPVFRVRGFKEDLEEAFITTVRFEHAAKVREIIAGGEYVDHELSGMRFIWEPEAVEFEGRVRERLGLPAEKARAEMAAAPMPEPREETEEEDYTVAQTNEMMPAGSTRVEAGEPLEEREEEDDSTVAKTNEMMLDEPPRIDAGEADVDPVFPLPPVTQPVSVRLERPPPASLRKPAEEKPPAPVLRRQAEEQRIQRVQVEARAPRPQEAPRAVVKATRPAPDDAAVLKEEAAEEGQLLVSKSWFIQGGTGNRNEALRISKVLKAFRWKVQPIYTIGVMLDDMLSIESSRNQISGTLISRIETAGYRLTAVTNDQGKPVAWFKKLSPDDSSNAPAYDGMAREEVQTSPSLDGSPDDLDADLEPDVTG